MNEAINISADNIIDVSKDTLVDKTGNFCLNSDVDSDKDVAFTDGATDESHKQKLRKVRKKSRSHTLSASYVRHHSSGQAEMGSKLLQAKITTLDAIKNHKIFTIQGGYSAVRESLRRRGWVEKFFKSSAFNHPVKRKKSKSIEGVDSDSPGGSDDDDNDTVSKAAARIPPWKEDGGMYAIMSRMVKYVNPDFYWVLRRDAIDFHLLSRDQVVNHYGHAGTFTTKVGLCTNMRNVPWFEDTNPDLFFPRCYRICNDEDRDSFIDDFRLTACMSILKLAVSAAEKETLKKNKTDGSNVTFSQATSTSELTTLVTDSRDFVTSTDIINGSAISGQDANSDAPNKPDAIGNTSTAVDGNMERGVSDLGHTGETDSKNSKMSSVQKSSSSTSQKNLQHSKRSHSATIPLYILHQAIQQCRRYIGHTRHDDIDVAKDEHVLEEEQWQTLLFYYYLLRDTRNHFESVPSGDIELCRNLIGQLLQVKTQFQMDGVSNVWIVKPGAKSRGRGIVCYSKLEDILALVSSQVARCEGKYVAQKYIEKPLLIYNTKFDIRQWFLVTDWNPLTVWFYKDCYLRFCSQQFTLDKFDEAIHLSNNSVQKHYKNGPRSDRLPEENMWSHYQFIDYLREHKHDHLWNEVIYPSMKKAVLCALMTTQDLVEYRKASFELYGADFMLTEDLNPWLLEINSSPSMERSTSVTARLCESVLDDTLKVVLDRKTDKNCGIGRFELAYYQAFISIPSYVGLNLSVDGQSLKSTEKQYKRSGKMSPAAISAKDVVSDSEIIFDEIKTDRKPRSALHDVNFADLADRIKLRRKKDSQLHAIACKLRLTRRNTSVLDTSSNNINWLKSTKIDTPSQANPTSAALPPLTEINKNTLDALSIKHITEKTQFKTVSVIWNGKENTAKVMSSRPVLRYMKRSKYSDKTNISTLRRSFSNQQDSLTSRHYLYPVSVTDATLWHSLLPYSQKLPQQRKIENVSNKRTDKTAKHVAKCNNDVRRLSSVGKPVVLSPYDVNMRKMAPLPRKSNVNCFDLSQHFTSVLKKDRTYILNEISMHSFT